VRLGRGERSAFGCQDLERCDGDAVQALGRAAVRGVRVAVGLRLSDTRALPSSTPNRRCAVSRLRLPETPTRTTKPMDGTSGLELREMRFKFLSQQAVERFLG